MKVIRLQNEIPEVYTEQSRDFQLLCRLYDCVINSTKFDVDGIKKITDTSKIRTNLLPLLQTKLGFFSNSKTDDYTLRMLLETFPSIIKKKGSLKAINEAITVYLKILGLRIPITITKTEGATQLYNITIPEHTIVIGLNTAFKNTAEIFKDLLSYVMPAGFGQYIYFFSSIEEITNFIYKDTVAVIYISDELDSLIRSNTDYTPDSVRYRIIGNVSLMGIVRKDTNLINFIPLNYSGTDLTIQVDKGIYTINGTAGGTSSKFIRVGYVDDCEVGDLISGCPPNGSSNTYELQLDKGGTYGGFDRNNGETNDGIITSVGTTNTVYIKIKNGYTANNLVFTPRVTANPERVIPEENVLDIYKGNEWEEQND